MSISQTYFGHVLIHREVFLSRAYAHWINAQEYWFCYVTPCIPGSQRSWIVPHHTMHICSALCNMHSLRSQSLSSCGHLADVANTNQAWCFEGHRGSGLIIHWIILWTYIVWENTNVMIYFVCWIAFIPCKGCWITGRYSLISVWKCFHKVQVFTIFS